MAAHGKLTETLRKVAAHVKSRVSGALLRVKEIGACKMNTFVILYVRQDSNDSPMNIGSTVVVNWCHSGRQCTCGVRVAHVTNGQSGCLYVP